MTDLGLTIAPKSDQINADDLIGDSKTIVITKVSLCAEADQPIAINFEGDNGKAYKPCKSMRRVLVNVWGRDGTAYVGRSMTLYRDDKVMFGGVAVGGIRISHMSHLAKDMTMALTATRANRKPFTVKPLKTGRTRREYLDQLHSTLAACHTEWEVNAVAQSDDVTKAVASFTGQALADLNAMLREALERVCANEGAADEPGPADEEPVAP